MQRACCRCGASRVQARRLKGTGPWSRPFSARVTGRGVPWVRTTCSCQSGRMLFSFLPTLGACATAPTLPGAWHGAAATWSRSAPLACALVDFDEVPWDPEEDDALLSACSTFTVGHGVHRVTFWHEMMASTPLLRDRTPEALRTRALLLSADVRVGRQPELLTSAERLPNGQLTGIAAGRTLWLNIAAERRADATSACPAHVETRNGQIFQLEMLHEAAATDAAMARAAAARTAALRLLSAVVSTADALLVSLRAARPHLGSGALMPTRHVPSKSWDWQDVYLSAMAATALLVGSQLLVLGAAAPALLEAAA